MLHGFYVRLRETVQTKGLWTTDDFDAGAYRHGYGHISDGAKGMELMKDDHWIRNAHAMRMSSPNSISELSQNDISLGSLKVLLMSVFIWEWMAMNN